MIQVEPAIWAFILNDESTRRPWDQIILSPGSVADLIRGFVVEVQVPREEEAADELLELQGDVQRNGDDVVEQHQEWKTVLRTTLG